MTRPIFHLAFPIRDVDSTVVFYREKLGFRIDLIEKGRCIIDFYGHQLVAHVSPKDVPEKIAMYPRHLGVILDVEKELDDLYARALKYFSSGALPQPGGADSVIFEELFQRFKDTPREHKTFFLKDPSNNLVEFKWYKNPSLIFKSHSDSPPLSKS